MSDHFPKLAWACHGLVAIGIVLIFLLPRGLFPLVGLGLVLLGLLLPKLKSNVRPPAVNSARPRAEETLKDLVARGAVLPTSHPRIFRVRDDGAAHNRELLADIDELIDLAVAGREAETEAKLWQIVRGECRWPGDECK